MRRIIACLTLVGFAHAQNAVVFGQEVASSLVSSPIASVELLNGEDRASRISHEDAGEIRLCASLSASLQGVLLCRMITSRGRRS